MLVYLGYIDLTNRARKHVAHMSVSMEYVCPFTTIELCVKESGPWPAVSRSVAVGLSKVWRYVDEKVERLHHVENQAFSFSAVLGSFTSCSTFLRLLGSILVAFPW